MSKNLLVQFVVVPGLNFEEGSIVEAHFGEQNGDKEAISIYGADGEGVAYAASQVVGNALESGASYGAALYKEVPVAKQNNPIKGEVVTLLTSGMIVKFVVGEPKKVKSSAERRFELKVGGSIRDYKAKAHVLKAFKAGTSVELKLTEGDKSDNGIAITYSGMLQDSLGNDVKAGAIRVNSDEQSELDELVVLVKEMGEVTANVISSERSSYTISVVIEADVAEAVKSGQPIPDLDTIKEQLIQDGISTEETLDEVIQYLQKYGVKVSKIRKVLETYKAYEDKDAAYIPKKPTTEFVDDGGFVNRSITYLLAGSTNPLRFTGEAGTGKNLLVTTLAWVFQRPLFEKAVNAELDKFDLLGSKSTDIAVDANGNQVTSIVFEVETFIRAMQVGGFCNLDEINTGNPGVLTLIHPVIDGRSYIDVPGYGRVKSDPNFNLFSTMNVGYAGTNPLNKATRDRFTTLSFEPNESILRILKSHADTRDCDEAIMSAADQLYRGMHKMVEDQELDEDCLTVRGFIRAVRFAEDNGVRESLIDNVANNIDEPGYREDVINFIDTIV